MHPLTYLLYSTVTLFFLVDPIGAMPIYLNLVSNHSAHEKNRTRRIAIVTAITTLVIFGFAGNAIFNYFGFTLGAFRIAGGILLFMMAVEMVFGSRRHKRSSGDTEDIAEKQAVGFVPLGIPILAGPGSIAASMILITSAPTFMDKIAVVGAIVVVMTIAHVVLAYADRIYVYIGSVGALAISRIMGLMLSAISVQMIVDGINSIWHLS